MAHVLGDFFFQPNSWVIEKEKKKLKSLKLYLHVLLHMLLIFLILSSFNAWKPALIIGASHLLIDGIKLVLQKPKTKSIWFFADQLMHIVVILACWSYYFNTTISFNFLQNSQFWLFAFGALLLTSPVAILIRIIIAKWIPHQIDAKKYQLLPYKMQENILGSWSAY